MKTFIADLGAHHVTDFGPPHGDGTPGPASVGVWLMMTTLVVSKGPRSKAALGD